MAKTGKRIPITDAKKIGQNHGYSQVIIVAWDDVTGTTSVCTWGSTLKQCDQAAQGGNFVKKALGWPDDKCQDKPARVKNKEITSSIVQEGTGGDMNYVKGNVEDLKCIICTSYIKNCTCNGNRE